jgi:hypothetical protein
VQRQHQPDAEDSESDTDEGSELGLEHVGPPSTKRPKGRPRTKRRHTGDFRGTRTHKRNLAEAAGEQIPEVVRRELDTVQHVKSRALCK